MNRILCIDTAVQAASVCIACNGGSIGLKISPSQKDQAAWLHVAIKELLNEQHTRLHQLDAIAISAGPGSYTGLRVGMATSKGLCYALRVPLITINTLQMMASAALEEPTPLLCPMIDARRMEVFTAVFNKSLDEIVTTQNLILNEKAYESLLQQHAITFFGNGSNKLRGLVQHPNAFFKDLDATAEHLSQLAFHKFQMGQFAELAYSEPLYGKEFYSPPPKPFLK